MGFIYVVKNNNFHNVFKVGKLNTLDNINPKLKLLFSLEDKNNILKPKKLLNYLNQEYKTYNSLHNYFIDDDNKLIYSILFYYKNLCINKTNNYKLIDHSLDNQNNIDNKLINIDDDIINNISSILIKSNLYEIINSFINLLNNTNIKYENNRILIYENNIWQYNEELNTYILSNLYMIIFYITNCNILDDLLYCKGLYILTKLKEITNL